MNQKFIFTKLSFLIIRNKLKFKFYRVKKLYICFPIIKNLHSYYIEIISYHIFSKKYHKNITISRMNEIKYQVAKI